MKTIENLKIILESGTAKVGWKDDIKLAIDELEQLCTLNRCDDCQGVPYVRVCEPCWLKGRQNRFAEERRLTAENERLRAENQSIATKLAESRCTEQDAVRLNERLREAVRVKDEALTAIWVATMQDGRDHFLAARDFLEARKIDHASSEEGAILNDIAFAALEVQP